MKFKSYKFIKESLISNTIAGAKVGYDIAGAGVNLLTNNAENPSMTEMLFINIDKVKRSIHISNTKCENLDNKLDRYYCHELDIKKKINKFNDVKKSQCIKAKNKLKCIDEMNEEIIKLKEDLIKNRNKIESYISSESKLKNAQHRDIGTYYGNEYET